ncbi:dystonin-like isoform X1 [Lethenteron reissneri]|uniref:dystonin-like isoform X1 n=1 Tax=Lethenteron reissneri TaxID=7753 RepID=UPI002AB63ECB|nr:dystonin-like isoform X1 [Lethenteron reissneri]
MGNSLGCVDNQELDFDPTKAPLEATSEVVNKTYKGKKKNKYTLKKRLWLSDPEALAKETAIPVDEVSLSTAVLNEFDLLSAQDDGRVKARLSKHSNISSLEEALDAQDEANQGEEEEEEEEVKEVIKETEVEGVKVTIIERTKSKVSKSSMQDSVSEMDQLQCGELSKDDGSLVSTGGSGLKRGSTSKKTMITTEIVLQEIASDADVGKSASMSRLEQVPRAKSGDHIAGQIHAISLHSVVDRKDRRGKDDLASAFQTSPTSPTSGPNPGQRRQILGEDGNESPLSDKHRAAGVTSRGGMVPIGAERYGSSNADFNGSSVSTLSDPDSGNFGQSVGKLSQMSPAKRRFFDLEQPVNIHPAISTTEGDTLVTPLKGKQERSNGKEDVSANLSGLGLAMQSKAPLGSMKVQDGESLGESNAPVKRAATLNEGHATGNADGWLKEDLAAQDNAVPFEVEMESATPALEARDSSHEMVSAGQAGGTPGRERLLAWARLVAKDVPGLSCHNFSSSWRDGRLLCAIVHAHRPGLVDLEEVRRRGARQNLEEALSLAESELGVPRLIDPEDVDVDAPDEKSIITYVSALHNALHKQGGQSRVALDANEDADEFWRLAASLRVWIEERTITLQSRTFPYSIDKLMVTQKEHALMKNSEFPKKKAELLQLEEVYKSMEPQLSNDGHEACRPDELHEAWSGLLNASANYEDAIVTEVQRLEMLQRLAQKMEVDTNTCAEGLNKVYEALQADVALINSGRAPQHGEEISRCLSEIEVFVQSLYPDVRTLTDGGCSQPELLQTRLRRLEEQVASLRAEHAKITSRAGEGARKRSRDEAQLQEASSQQDQTAAAYLQELLTWVQSNQVTVDKSGYGKDLDETTALLEEQKALHQTIENFRSSLGEAQQTMQSVSQGSRYDYSKSLDKLEQQYSKLLNGSRARLGLLENQQGFLRRCQREMLWLTQREEREVAYDWSDLNPDLEPKKEAYALLVRELEQREPAFREVVQTGEDLVGEGHPGKPTIQAYLLALKTQWSWLLQLCSCVETHLAENAVYFQFFKDARELEQQLRRVQDAVRRRYACDVSTPLARLENLLQDAQEEKEQLSELKVGASKLHKRAKGVVQLKPRRPDFSPRSPTPVTALCNYHQDQVTLTKHDECSLSGAEDGRWTVSSPSGRSGTVPSVCFLVPAPNKEALDSAARVEQRYQDSVSLWKQLYGKMQGLLLWQHLHADMGIVMAWNIDNFRGLAEQDYLSVMDALESHYGQLEGHNEASQAFSAAEMQQLRGDVAACRTRYQQLLEQLVLEERTDEDSEQLLSDLAALSQRLRECQEQLTHGVRAPLDAETAQYVQLCLTAQEGLHREVESLGSEVDRMAQKCEPVLNQGVASPRLHALRSQLEQLQHSLQQTHSLSLLYREKLSMLNEVKSSMEETERLLGSYEGRLSEESAIPNETDGIDAYRNTVRQWQTEVSQKRRSMRGLEEALGRALTVGERLSRTHGEACVDLARMRDATQALQGRWDSVEAQVDSRVRDLEKLSRILGHYRQSYQTIMQWVQEVGGQQEEPLPTQTADYQELSSQLNQHKELVTEIDKRQDKVNECQRYSEQYRAALKEYEMQLMEYRALVESAHSGPSRHQWQQSEADTIAQEFLDLRGRYTALVNLTGHRVKTISDSLQHLQQQEETTGKCTGIGGEFVSSDRGEDWGGEETADTCAGSPAPQVFSDESPSSTQNALPEQDATDSAICLNEDSDDAQIAREAEEDPARDATFSLGSLDGSEALHAECDSHRSASEMCADGDDDKDDEDETQGCELESPSVFSREHVDLATMLDQRLEDDEPEDASKAREGDPNSQEQQFLDSWKAMHTWLLEISDALSQEPGCDDGIDTLTERLLKLKELQGGLRAHEEAYEECVDLGELAVEAAALTSNHGQLQSMLGEMRGTWEKVQALSAEREQSLEASLMLSGQLVDALQALSAWLDGVEPLLSPDFPVLGDMDTVARLLREHQALREELSEHGQSAEFVRRASRECAVLGGGNSCGMVERSEALLARWEAVCWLATAKETRLHAALQQAEELARAMTRQLEWCTLADRMLYPHDALPEEEEALQELAKQHAEWMLELESREEEMARISGLADAILSTCHPDGTISLKQCLASVHNNFQEVSGRAWRLQAWLDTSLRELEEQAHLAEEMFLWLQEAQDSLAEKETELLPQDEESIQGLIDEHQSLMERMMLKQPEMDRLGRCNRRKLSSESQLSGTLSPFLDKTRTRKLSGSQPDSPVSSPLSPGPLSEPRDPHVTALVACWHQVWLAALERQGRLRDALQQSQTMWQEMEQEKFSFAQWRKRFSQQTKLKKSRLMDIFKRLDGDQDGRITRDEFAREISLLGLGSEEWELDAVVGRFGVQEGTLVDYYQFVSELCPSKAGGSMTDADKIDDEVIRKVSACKCSRRFQVEQVEENKYRFGDSQQLRLVRILRSTVMVRVGGGWLSLDDFLQKNDPCRAKGRTNVDLRERLSSGEGGGKAMVLFRSKSGGGKVAAPSRHNSTSSLPSLSACPEDAAPAGGSRDSQQASDAAANKFKKSGNGKSGRKERIGQLSCSVSSIPSHAPSSAGSHKPSGIPPATTAEARPGNISSSRVSPTQRRSGTAPAPLARMATKVEPSTAPAADGPNQKASRPLPAKVSKIPTHASHATSRTATSNGPKH